MTKKTKTSSDEKLDKQDFVLFEALSALDNKDYAYFDSLSEEQKRKFVPFMLTHWMSAIKASKGLQEYYLRSTDHHANKYLLHESIQKHPKLQWQMLCASSPGMGKQFHQWIPHLSAKVTTLRDTPNSKDLREYFSKIYPKTDVDMIREVSDAYIQDHKKKVYLAKIYPNLKFTDIETLSQIVTDEDIKQYEKDSGNL
jgi:hypothetical protein